jgi:hypothetical protein
MLNSGSEHAGENDKDDEAEAGRHFRRVLAAGSLNAASQRPSLKPTPWTV